MVPQAEGLNFYPHIFYNLPMKRLSSLFVAILLSLQLTLAGAVGSFTAVADDVHQVFSHAQAVDHHHHDAFVTHTDHSSGEAAHQHVTDHSQTSAVLPDSNSLFVTATTGTLSSRSPSWPLAVFLDGLLRPPRTIL